MHRYLLESPQGKFTEQPACHLDGTEKHTDAKVCREKERRRKTGFKVGTIMPWGWAPRGNKREKRKKLFSTAMYPLCSLATVV